MTGADTRQTDSLHPWSKPYYPQCIKLGCSSKPYWDGTVYYSLCLHCLKENSFGPFKRKIIKEDYSTLFWVGDYENAQSRKEIA
jgi:hypothetical protein